MDRTGHGRCVSGKEAGGIARLLAEATPGLAGAAQEGKAVALPQLNRLSLCGSKVLIPTGNQTVNDPFSTGGPNYREFLYALTDFAGQSQNFDGNGPYFRIQPGGGDLLVGEPNPDGNLTTDKTGYAFTEHAAARRRAPAPGPSAEEARSALRQAASARRQLRRHRSADPDPGGGTMSRSRRTQPLEALSRDALASDPRAKQRHDRDHRPGPRRASR